jgi:hypothetical protein
MGARVTGAAGQRQSDRSDWSPSACRLSSRWTRTRTTTSVTQLMINDQRLTYPHQSLNEVALLSAPRTAKMPSTLSAVMKVRRICAEATWIRLDSPKATASMIGENRDTSPPISRQIQTPGVAVSNTCRAFTEAGVTGCRYGAGANHSAVPGVGKPLVLGGGPATGSSGSVGGGQEAAAGPGIWPMDGPEGWLAGDVQ